MTIRSGTEYTCAKAFLPPGLSANELVQDYGMSVGTATMQALRDCDGRPATEGGPTNRACEGCGLRIKTKVREGLRAMAERVNSSRSVLE